MHLVSKLQPDPTSSPQEEVGSNMVVKVDPGHLRSCVQDLQQNVVSVIIRFCNVHENSFDRFQEGCYSAKLTSFRNVGLSGLW